jgi:hypothetical protein
MVRETREAEILEFPFDSFHFLTRRAHSKPKSYTFSEFLNRVNACVNVSTSV